MKWYFAAGTKEGVDMLLEEKVSSILMSFAYCKRGLPEALVKAGKKTDIMVDSGGFTEVGKPGSSQLEGYMEFLISHKKLIDEYVTLDHPHKREITFKNYAAMIDKGHDPLFVDHMWFPWDDRLEKIYKNKKLCWGGMENSWAEKQIKRMDHALDKLLHDPSTKMHALGVGQRLKRFLPWMDALDSFDSSTWRTALGKFGKWTIFEHGTEEHPMPRFRQVAPPWSGKKPGKEVYEAFEKEKLSGHVYDDRIRMAIRSLKKYYAAIEKFHADNKKKGHEWLHEVAMKKDEEGPDNDYPLQVQVSISLADLKAESGFRSSPYLPAHVQKRHDGFKMQAVRKCGVVTLLNDQAQDETERFPLICKQLASLNPATDFVFDAVLEARSDILNLSSEEVTKGIVNEDRFVLSVLDVVRTEIDVREKSFVERSQILDTFDFPQASLVSPSPGLNRSPSMFVRDSEEAEEAVLKMNKIAGSRGAVLHSEIVAEIENEQPVTKAVSEKNDPYLTIPPEDRKYPYVVHQHWRGKGVHSDFRIGFKPEDLALGWTLNTAIADAIKEPVTNLAEARQAAKEKMGDYSKINWRTGEWALRDKMGVEKPSRTSILAEKKNPAPWKWLEVEGVTKVPEEGEALPVGGTRNFPGVFLIVDRGDLEFGAQKPWFHEYFVQGDSMNYRVIFRQLKMSAEVLPPSEGDNDGEGSSERWLFARPDELRPYVLDKEAVAKGWMPPAGVSALPEAIRIQVPKHYQYWTISNQANAKMTRDYLVDDIEKKEVILDFEASYKRAVHKRNEEKEMDFNSTIRFGMPIAKVDKDKQLVTGIVLEPDAVDAQGDTIDREAIERAAHNFLAKYNRETEMGLLHQVFGEIGVELVESYLAPVNLEIGGQSVSEGTWLMTVRVKDDKLWKKIKEKEITGFSIGGVAAVV